jgi:hypothetical protein
MSGSHGNAIEICAKKNESREFDDLLANFRASVSNTSKRRDDAL